MEELLRREPRIIFDIVTTVPEWFFAGLSPASVRFHKFALDVGLVQLNPLEEDLGSTILKLESLIANRDQLFDSLMTMLRKPRPHFIVSDIAPLGLELARRLQVPSCLIENFRWEWIYEPYLAAESRFGEFCELFTELNREATFHIQCQPVSAPPEGLRSPDLICNPIARQTRGCAEAIREALLERAEKPLVLVTMGGIPASFPFIDRLREQREVLFVLPASVSQVQLDGGIILLPQSDPQFYHPDLVAAVDLVVGKAGYSTMAEVLNAGTPYLFIPRPSSRESDVLADFILAHFPSRQCSHHEFISGEWLGMIPELLASSEMRKGTLPTDGGGVVAEFLLATLGSA